MARNYAALPYDYLEEMDALNDAEFGRLTRALLTYSKTGEQIALCGNERFYAKRVMSQEDRFKESYEEQTKKRSEAGKKGMANRYNKTNNVSGVITEPNKTNKTETKTNTETNISLTTVRDKKRFVPPTLSEIADYCRERGNEVDPKKFFDYFEANDWVDSKGQKVKSWKQKVISWEGRGDNKPKGKNDALLESLRRDMAYDTSRNQGMYISDVATLVEL